VSDLTPLKDKPLTELYCHKTLVSDLSPLAGMPLKTLHIYDTGITDLTPLQGMPLEEIRLTPRNIAKGLDILRDMKSLTTIGIDYDQSWPAAEFWKRYETGEFGKAIAPFTEADVQRIAALPATQQVEEVRKELKRRNPGFDGKMKPKIVGGVVTELRIMSDLVADIGPIRVFDSLRVLECSATSSYKPHGLLADLTPLAGMKLAGLTSLYLMGTQVRDAGMVCFKDCKNLTSIDLYFTQVTDAGLANFKDCKNLKHLYLSYTRVSDAGLSNFKDCKNLEELWLINTQVGDAGMVHFQDCKALTDLRLARTNVSDAGLVNFKGCKNLKLLYLDYAPVGDAGLAQFKGMPLRKLAIDSTGITDVTPLQGMPLEEIRLTPKNITKGLDLLHDMKSLKTIGISWESDKVWPAAEFWERYDKGEFNE
jgi:Leucine-rich repeat (LRR) protein